MGERAGRARSSHEEFKRNSLHSILSLSPDSQMAFNNDPDVITDLFAFHRTSSRLCVEICTILMKWGVLFGN
jgi:hypothetical protein